MQRESQLWYNKPASQWNHALPVGNGRMGAMVFGGVHSERIQLNEDSVWSGGYRDRNNPDAKTALPQIRQLLKDGKISQAEELSRYALTGTPEYQRAYQTLGDLFINFQNMPEAADYRRSLCLGEAIAAVSFTAGGHQYRREVLASAPADVIAIRLTTNNPAGLSFDTRLVRNRLCETTGAVSKDTIYISGGEGIKFVCAMAGVAEGGEMTAIGEYLVFRGVSAATLYITAATSFRFDNPMRICQEILQNAKDGGFPKLREEHIKDYQGLESRVAFSLAKADSNLPTDKRLELLRQGQADLGLMELYFRYGRYLLISCSRPGSLPANLQGVWCNDFLPPWDSKYTININTQMNYWPAEICNLPECHMPLFDHLRRMYRNGQETARKMYGARGFVAHHNTDIWGDTAPQDTYTPATYWVMSVAWFCLHIFEHYEYTGDKNFLAQNFELMTDACLFFADFLIENASGQLVVSPTVSPENRYWLDGAQGTLCEGCTMDSQILHELFNAFEATSQILGKEQAFAAQVATMRAKLPPTSIGKNGGIMEWLQDHEEAEPGHRHMSHLFALFPGSMISPEATPEFADAARQTLKLRLSHGGGHTGWSRAWIINFRARLGEGDEAHFNLLELLKNSTLPNLFDDHPPFQIDGNFGATAAIAHMLVQSTADKIYLLKALPSEWPAGEISGIRAKGGLTVSLTWADGKLEKASFTASHPYCGVVICGDKQLELKLNEGETFEWIVLSCECN
ncbi:MAG: glycoside hydrolase family 95 protein [Defluviitaleaceae bacterium]|nr:glycoside hydrolase family 95 protein [Defluviitaleaceae bacterium]